MPSSASERPHGEPPARSAHVHEQKPAPRALARDGSARDQHPSGVWLAASITPALLGIVIKTPRPVLVMAPRRRPPVRWDYRPVSPRAQSIFSNTGFPRFREAIDGDDPVLQAKVQSRLDKEATD